MPVLKPQPLVEYDANNPEHVEAYWEVELGHRRTCRIAFNWSKEFSSWVAYARYRNSMAHAKRLLTEAGIPFPSTPLEISNRPVIGLKAPRMQETATRVLPPGTVITPTKLH